MVGDPSELYAFSTDRHGATKGGCIWDPLPWPASGLTNAEVGRTLGIYGGHVGHVGHVSRVILNHLEEEGVAAQDPGSKKWILVRQSNGPDDPPT